jgi:hypothetical protein
MVERGPEESGDGGSNPPPSATKYKIPLDLVGLKCFDCGGPATMWRKYLSPIVPYCYSCWIDSTFILEGGRQGKARDC